ncbi:MAG: endolytic transglycosylase MltG [Candidatus Thermochlorobacter sp.]
MMQIFWRVTSKLLFLLFMLGTVALGFAYMYLFKSSLNSERYAEPKLIKIHRGMSFMQIANELQKEGVIKHTLPLQIVARFMPELTNIKPGRYYIPSGMTSAELLRFMYTRKQDEVKVRIPEVSRGPQVAQIIGQSLDTDSATFMKAFSDSALLKELDVDAPNFEGYFLANTYTLPWSMTAEDVIRYFVKELRKVFNDSLRELARKRGLSEVEVLTLASIVEAETGLASERPLVAGVYLNRLEKGMLLQADPTFIYAAILDNDYDGNPNNPKHRKRDSPYNTYLYRGLPPGPIGNPTKESILAVLNPAKTKYLFFVATGYGGHRFAETAEQHAVNAALYYARRKELRDSLKAAAQQSLEE